MKKTTAILLALVLALGLFTACGPIKKIKSEEKVKPLEMGHLALLSVAQEGLNTRAGEDHITYYDDLNTMLLALKSGKIERILGLPEIVAGYISARNSDLITVSAGKYAADIKYHMGILHENEEVFKLINDAIITLKEKGRLDELGKEFIDAYLNGGDEPKAAELPHFGGAKEIIVAVTGDLPPMDYVGADGVPAGFNVALLSAIAETAKINIRIITITTESKLTALKSEIADVIFWFSESDYEDGDKLIDAGEGVDLTESYFETKSTILRMAPEK